MKTAISNLKLVAHLAPAELQPRIAKVIQALVPRDTSSPNGVASPLLEDRPEPKSTALSLLQDNADSFLALMRTLPKDHPFKKAVEEVGDLTTKLSAKLEESGKALQEILQTDEQDLPGISATTMGSLAELLVSEKEKLSELEDLSKTLTTLAGKVHKEKENSPVDHKLPSKDVGKNKKKEDKEDQLSSLNNIGPALDEVPDPGQKNIAPNGTPVPTPSPDSE